MQSVHACAIQTDILHLILTPFFERQKEQKIQTVLDLRRGTCDTSKIRGELETSRQSGSILEASGDILEAYGSIWTHPEGIWEASGRHLGHLGGIWEASGRHQGGV